VPRKAHDIELTSAFLIKQKLTNNLPGLDDELSGRGIEERPVEALEGPDPTGQMC